MNLLTKISASVAGCAFLGFWLILIPCHAESEANQKEALVEEGTKEVALRLVAYNVACGQWATPQELGRALEVDKPDVVFLNEVPTGNDGVTVPDWSGLVAAELGLEHVYVGTISSAHHKAPGWGDVTGEYGGKVKSIISRWPLKEGEDIETKGRGWSPASSIRVVTEVGGHRLALYALHLPGTGSWEDSTHQSLAAAITKRDAKGNVIVAGDFNERTESPVMKRLEKDCALTNAVKERSIDHILYRTLRESSVKGVEVKWGPKAPAREKKPLRVNRRGHLSDHPWVTVELLIREG